MDIREYNSKSLPYHFVLFYNLPLDKFIFYKRVYEGRSGDNAILTYCYIDSQCGMSFKGICWASVSKEGNIIYHHDRKMTTGLTIREGGLECDAAVFEEKDMRLFQKHADEIKEIYGHLADQTDINGDVQFDEFRHPAYPNDILVSFYAPNKKLEKMWVREQSHSKDGVVTAILINEPYNPLLGLHEGDMVKVIGYDIGDGKMTPLAVLEWMR